MAADVAHWEKAVEALKGMERLSYAGFGRQTVAALRNARTSLEAVADRRGVLWLPRAARLFHQIRTGFGFSRSPACSGVAPNASKNSGVLYRAPSTRNRGGECGLVST